MEKIDKNVTSVILLAIKENPIIIKKRVIVKNIHRYSLAQ
jgi:hypothetical protein